jgi:hypothetical protein
MAHFLCLDRWGPPTAAELRDGMPFHETSRVEWKQLGANERQAGRIVAVMEATLPIAGLEVRRTVTLGVGVVLHCFRNSHQSKQTGSGLQHGPARDYRPAVSGRDYRGGFKCSARAHAI